MWHGVVEKGPVHALLFAQDSQTLYSVDGNKTVQAWAPGIPTGRVLFQHGHSAYACSLHLSLDGVSLLLSEAVPSRGRYWCWDRSLDRLVYPGDTTKDPGGPFWFFSSVATWPCFTQESRIYFCEPNSGKMSYFNWPPKSDGMEIDLPRGYNRKIIRRMISDPQGLRIAIWFTDDTVLIWDRTGEMSTRRSKQLSMMNPPPMSFSPDGRYLALGTATGITILDATTGKVAQQIASTRSVTDLTFHPSNQLLAGADGRAIVVFWDVRSGQVHQEFSWKIGRVRSLVFAPDGLTCAAGGTQKKFVVWDVE